jgi:hypothetical protein
MLVYQHAAIEGQAGSLGELEPRPHTDAHDDEIRLELVPARKPDVPAVDRARRLAKMEDDAVLFVQVAHEVAQLRSQHLLHGPFAGRNDVHFDVARA